MAGHGSRLPGYFRDGHHLDGSGGIGYSFWAYGLLAFYIAQGVVVMLLLRRREAVNGSFRRLVHAADIVWPALISIFATGLADPFFLFFVFVLAAAAYRWGLWETFATAAPAFRFCGWRASRSLWVSSTG